MSEITHMIRGILPGSIAEELQLDPGDELVAIGGKSVRDIFDYEFMIREPLLEVHIRKHDSREEWILEIEKDPEEDLGLVFDTGLMDEYHSCRNHCIFCFIDQNPPGMRETIYFKDDDERLSFLQGNYVTLTNMTEDDIDRIIRYRMEPINISFHTTDPALRVRMLANRTAGEALQHVRRLADAGIAMNGQIVLCKGINDGEALEKTLRDLITYLPALKSVSVVPVGLTDHREGCFRLEPFDKEDSARLIAQIHRWQETIFAEHGTHLVHASDEWYLRAEMPIPQAERYDGYLQLENGVGRMRLLMDEVQDALERREGDLRCRRLSLPTGTLITPVVQSLIGKIRARFPQVEMHHYPIRNDFFGEKITVTGLVTGGDLIAQLQGKELGEVILLPSHMLRAGEEVFLDDVTVSDVEEALHAPVLIVDMNGEDLCRAVLGEEEAPGRETFYKRRQYYEQTDRGDRRPAECREIDPL